MIMYNICLLKCEFPFLVIRRWEALNCPDSYGGTSIPAMEISDFLLLRCLMSPISAISKGPNVFPTPDIAMTTSYSGKVLANEFMADIMFLRLSLMLSRLLINDVTASLDTSSKETEGMADLLSSYILAGVEL